MEKQYIYWDTGAGCLLGGLAAVLAAAGITVSFLLGWSRLAALLIAAFLGGGVGAIAFLVDRRSGRRPRPPPPPGA